MKKLEKIRKQIWESDFRVKVHMAFLLHFNRVLGRYGQNAYCKKSDVKNIVANLGYRWRDNPVARSRFQEALDDIEQLKP